MLDEFLFKQNGLNYLRWCQKNPIGKIPKDVAKEGAGENRIPFTHYANSLPVYLISAKMINELKKTKAFILDIGCGTGRNISFVKDNVNKKNYYYYGIDYSNACIKYARIQYRKQGVNFIQYEGKIFPFPDKSFDFIISSHVIEHIKKKDALLYLSEISRVLKKDGIAVIGTPNRKYCQDLFYLNKNDELKYRFILPHEHEYYYEELKKLFDQKKLFKKYVFYGTTNKINRYLMTEGAKKIKPRPDFLSRLKFNIYSYLRINPRLQDFMAKLGTELMLWRMKKNYYDIITSTYLVKNKYVKDADNFVVIAFK